jgi:hypothetical protein
VIEVDGFIQRAFVLNAVLFSVIVLPLYVERAGQIEALFDLRDGGSARDE